MEWLFAPIDPARAHEVASGVAWHGRSMVLAWGILAPLAVLIARFYKVLPGQDWPQELDSQVWWRGHWMGQSLVLLLTGVGLGLVFQTGEPRDLHAKLGYSVIVLVCAQVGLGVFRGTKGGPTSPAPDGSLRGDHYDMTPWRVMFEWVHKSVGYALLLLASLTLLLGMWDANAPLWMWLVITLWWIGFALLFVALQRQGHAVDTYQAIWGPGTEHPGNHRKPIGWGIRRDDDHRQPGE
ncbi:hypothetical protein So717_26240 [Roseobacter cerasinus]|uniref:Cytochrome b561 domain-containing protein n=1 Tax=Roseobacter cerasinus TaxID=2602289 RepID=A0A640VUV1_9RHOB|nr:cytochrome b561 domain-containing protein [Roseobacter cerasinus]GFE50871.1 hypothetical protein So717_26240 [Roseobacter cerasinus]